MPVEPAIRTIRSKFEATPAASTIAAGPIASTTAVRVASNASDPETIASANATSVAPWGTRLSWPGSASAVMSARSPSSALLSRSSQAWALIQ